MKFIFGNLDLKNILLPFGSQGKRLLLSILLWIIIIIVIGITIFLPIYFLVINKSNATTNNIINTISATTNNIINTIGATSKEDNDIKSSNPLELINLANFYPTGTIIPFESIFYDNQDAINKSIYYLGDFINKCTNLYINALTNNLKNLIYIYIIDYHNLITTAQNYLKNTNSLDIISLQTVSLLAHLASKLNELQNKTSFDIIPLLGNPKGDVNPTCPDYICQSKYLLKKLDEYLKQKQL
jgi:hypothetical protein